MAKGRVAQPDGSAGLPADAAGNPAIDPTANVTALVEAGMRRQDDLRDAESVHVREIMDLRALHYAELRAAEAARLDAIRRVDVEATARAAEALRTTVEATAKVTAEQISGILRAQYEQQGQRAADSDTTIDRRATTTIALLVVGLAVSLLIGVAGIVAALTA